MSEVEDIDIEIIPKEKSQNQRKKRKITQVEIIAEKLFEMDKKIL